MTSLPLSPEALRLVQAGLVLLAYGLLCAAAWRKPRAAASGGEEPGAPVLVAFASQTGLAQMLAARTVQSLRAGGTSARLAPLGELQAKDLQAAQRALFIVSTHGEGGAPDNAQAFERRVMRQALSLDGRLQVGVLALGDSSYTDYRGFGLRLDGWLRRSGALPLFPRVDVDRGDEAALRVWRQELARVAGEDEVSPAAPPPSPAFEPWRLVSRRVLNPGSAGAPLCLVELLPLQGALPAWQSGDLAQLRLPQDAARAREYSIASLPPDGALRLLVRQERHADGTLGLVSGWLTQHAALGDTIELALRAHEGFRLGDNARRPLILVGNGSGLAGLLSHLGARAAGAQDRQWLVFGERQAAFDDYARALLAAHPVRLARADLVFSRDGGGSARYVQDVLRREAARVREWVAQGAAIYVCGSLRGMAAGVDEVLREVLGEQCVDALIDDRRYCRDVY